MPWLRRPKPRRRPMQNRGGHGASRRDQPMAIDGPPRTSSPKISERGSGASIRRHAIAVGIAAGFLISSIGIMGAATDMAGGGIAPRGPGGGNHSPKKK